MKKTNGIAVIAASIALTSFVLAPAMAQQPNHHPGQQAQAGKTAPGGAGGAGAGGAGGGMMKKPGMMGKGGMMGGGKGSGGMMGGGRGSGGMMGMMKGKGGMMGMMHKKMHRKMMGKMGFKRAKAFNAQDIARIVDGKLSFRGFTRLKAANVKIKNDKMATADIVSVKGEFIAKITVNRKNGMAKIVE